LLFFCPQALSIECRRLDVPVWAGCNAVENSSPVLNTNVTDAIVICDNSRGAEVQGTLLRLARHEVSFEIYSAAEIVQVSEVLSNFRILVRERAIYSGRAVITSAVNAGPVLVCQANLQDSWLDIDIVNLARQPGQLPAAFDDLIRGWQSVYKISPEYKVVIADIQSFLFELRHWVDEVELGVDSANGSRASAERQAFDQLLQPVIPCLNDLFERFELASRTIPPEAQPTYGVYAKRQLHPLLLCSPFMHRIYRKPLGYAGDYEMVNMILRDPLEGSSLYAKVLNSWFLSQVPAAAHRNRVRTLTQHLIQETGRTLAQNRPARIYNLGCGPAQEVRDFLEQSAFSDHAEFTLLDFNEETLAYTRTSLESVRRRHNRRTRIQLVKKSVAQVVKSGMRSVSAEYDLVYCAGLFDYLPDRVCQQLLTMFYAMLAPGGLLLATNVDPSNPIRNIMGFIFEWCLLERTGPQMQRLAPEATILEHCKISAEATGCNVFIEIRKPA
jgi:extracellular factor (EF) 3-hydroxypalmitic acid methyl ester biosynthesis protein